jgi:hypothetical protein
MLLRTESPERFQFDDYIGEADEIRTIGRPQDVSPEPDWERYLCLKGNRVLTQYRWERLPINGLEEAASQRAMHHHGASDDRVGLRIQN